MNLVILVLMIVGVFGFTASTAAAGETSVVGPLSHAHAHNDYLHARPLLDALDRGFTSIEADVYLVGHDLLVGHDFLDLRPWWTLQTLYLEPLRQRVLDNGGSVYAGHCGGFQLLVDIKAVGTAAYNRLDELQRDPRYAFLFTRSVHGTVQPGAITL
ncbi:hypothetical protein, partial [Nocardia amamiensis]|uniref:hypothetical protein n=1 Tax=Nocardia amamiensis TaxID=404578 RepID=UPI001C3FF4F2